MSKAIFFAALFAFALGATLAHGPLQDTVVVDGRYVLKPVLDVDLKNGSSVKQTHEVMSLREVSYEGVVQHVVSRLTNEELTTAIRAGVGVKVDFLSIDLGGSESGRTASMLTSALTESLTTKSLYRHQEKITTEIEVPAGKSVSLFQVYAEAPGISIALGAFVTGDKVLPDKAFQIKYKLTTTGERFLKAIDVVRVSSDSRKPADAITEVDGLSNDVNKDFGGDYVYLVPRWTYDPSEAASGISVIIQEQRDASLEDVASGAGGMYRYIQVEKTTNPARRITSIYLWRSAEGTQPSSRGYTWSSGDLNKGRGGDYLFLCGHHSTAVYAPGV